MEENSSGVISENLVVKSIRRAALWNPIDVVMFVFREDYYHDKMEPIRKSGETEEQHNERYENWKSYFEKIKGQAQIIIAKQRHGPVGTVELFFNGELTLFDDLDRHMIALLQLTFIAAMLLTGHNLEFSVWYFLGLATALILFIYQHYLTWARSRDGCFNAFLNNLYPTYGTRLINLQNNASSTFKIKLTRSYSKYFPVISVRLSLVIIFPFDAL